MSSIRVSPPRRASSVPQPRAAASVGDELRWLGIQGRHLSALLTVAREGTFAAAAERLGYTQSTISHQVATLEKLVGSRLVERSPGAGSVSLTRAGELLLEHATAIVARLGAARADIARADEHAATLRVGVFQSVGTSLLPRVVAGLARELPDLHLELLHDDPRDRLPDLVARGELDLAFALGPIRHEALRARELLREPFVLLLPPGARRRSAEWRSSTLAAPVPCASQERTEEALRARGLRPRDVVRVDDLSVIEALVAAGSAVGLVPRSSLGHGDLTVVELDGASVPRSVVVCWHGEREPSHAAVRVVQLAEAAAGVPSKPSMDAA